MIYYLYGRKEHKDLVPNGHEGFYVTVESSTAAIYDEFLCNKKYNEIHIIATDDFGPKTESSEWRDLYYHFNQYNRVPKVYYPSMIDKFHVDAFGNFLTVGDTVGYFPSDSSSLAKSKILRITNSFIDVGCGNKKPHCVIKINAN